jgi:hypothetical protein
VLVYSLVHLYIEARTYRRVRTQSCIDVMVSECDLHALANEVRLSGVYSAQYMGQDNLRFRGFKGFLYFRFTSRITFVDSNKLRLNCKENYPTNNSILQRKR